MKPIGILGGTFDPVHNGHLRLALESRTILDLDQVRLIPAAVPPHRNNPATSAAQRYRMLELAIAETRGLSLDDRELQRAGVSYTIDTLMELRQELNDQPLCLIMGMDAFQTLNEWHRWTELLDYAHIIFVYRPGSEVEFERQAIATFHARHLAEDHSILHQSPAGLITRISVPLLDISASRIRAAIAAGRDISYLLPSAVISYIKQESLYQ